MIDKEIIEDEDFVIPEYQHFINTCNVRFTKFDNHKYLTFYIDDDYSVKCLIIGNVIDEDTLKIIKSKDFYVEESSAQWDAELEKNGNEAERSPKTIDVINNGLFNGTFEVTKEELTDFIKSLEKQLAEFE